MQLGTADVLGKRTVGPAFWPDLSGCENDQLCIHDDHDMLQSVDGGWYGGKVSSSSSNSSSSSSSSSSSGSIVVVVDLRFGCIS